MKFDKKEHKKLVRAAIGLFGCQIRLADLLTKLRDGPVRKEGPINQSTVSRWRSGQIPVPVEAAILIDELTEGDIRADEFYPQLREWHNRYESPLLPKADYEIEWRK